MPRGKFEWPKPKIGECYRSKTEIRLVYDVQVVGKVWQVKYKYVCTRPTPQGRKKGLGLGVSTNHQWRDWVRLTVLSSIDEFQNDKKIIGY